MLTSFARRCLLVIAFAAATFAAGTGADKPTNPNAPFGLPGPAVADPTEREHYLIERPEYTLSYNATTRCPNWACWRLRADDIGKAKRGPFEPDPLLPRGIARVSSHAYDGGGFDRGHMCPAQDRSHSQKAMDATFFTTNIVPQAPNCNQRAWERLESYCRDLTKQEHVLYICCGPYGVGGTGKDGHKEEIGKGTTKVTVPAKVWKVVLVLPREGAEPRRNTRAIAVILPNDQSVDHDWAKYRVPVKAVEKLTGLTFFPEIEPEVSAAIKADADDVKVRTPKSKRD